VLASREGPTRATAAGAAFGVAAAIGFGLFFVGIDEASASADDALWPILVMRVASVTVLSAIVLATRTRIPTGRDDLTQLVPIGVLDTGANLLFALATRVGDLSIVGVLGALYPVVTVLLAFRVLGERLHSIQWVGAVAALAGAALITAG
jgi:drug/metabolite transporter (DMT)-like permease